MTSTEMIDRVLPALEKYIKGRMPRRHKLMDRADLLQSAYLGIWEGQPGSSSDAFLAGKRAVDREYMHNYRLVGKDLRAVGIVESFIQSSTDL